MTSIPASPGRRTLPRALSVALSLGAASLAFGQTAPETKDTVTLPQFTITEKVGNPYQSGQALSASRVAMAVQDIPQTISVIPREFIMDSGADRMLDAAKYVTPSWKTRSPTAATVTPSAAFRFPPR